MSLIHMVFFDKEGCYFDGKMSHFEDAFGGVRGQFYAAWCFARSQGWGVIAYNVSSTDEALSENQTNLLVSQGQQCWDAAPSKCWRMEVFAGPLRAFYPVQRMERSPRANWLIQVLYATEPDLLIDHHDVLGRYDLGDRHIDIHTAFDPEQLLAALDAFDRGDRDLMLQYLRPRP